MIDIATLALTHGLMALALWRMLFCAELDLDSPEARPRRPWKRDPEQARSAAADA